MPVHHQHRSIQHSKSYALRALSTQLLYKRAMLNIAHRLRFVYVLYDVYVLYVVCVCKHICVFDLTQTT